MVSAVKFPNSDISKIQSALFRATKYFYVGSELFEYFRTLVNEKWNLFMIKRELNFIDWIYLLPKQIIEKFYLWVDWNDMTYFNRHFSYKKLRGGKNN